MYDTAANGRMGRRETGDIEGYVKLQAVAGRREDGVGNGGARRVSEQSEE